jgi:GABA permease
MRNPVRSEAEAFRFVLLTLVYFALIVIGALINVWVGLAVFIVLTPIAGWFAFFREDENAPAQPRVRPTAQDATSAKRILVVANETVGGDELARLIDEKARGSHAEVLVVAPALNSPVGTLTGDGGSANADAQARLDASLRRLREQGVNARGEVSGEPDPIQSIEDALRTFGADEIVISTHPEGSSKWLEAGTVEKARERFAVPITHVVVHGGAREEVRR